MSAIVAVPPDGSFGDELVKDSGAMAFYAVSKSNFCPVLRLGLFGIEFFEIQTPNRVKKLAGGGIQGNAILTRFSPKKYFRVDLPVAFDWVNAPESMKEIVRREKREGARFALCIEFDYFGRSVIICSTHLEDKDGGVEEVYAEFT